MLKKDLIKILKSGGIGVMPTDTIYGLAGQALKPKTVARIYRVRRRSPDKPLIILIGSLADLKKFGIKLQAGDKKILAKIWPAAVSVVLPCPKPDYKYLHRGTKTLAFRLPAQKWLRGLLRQTGPLVAPSANPEGLPPAVDLAEAEKYFGKKVDCYYDRGRREAPPSTLVTLVNGRLAVLRQGQVKIKTAA